MTQHVSRIYGIDFEARGKQIGYLSVEHSNNDYDAAVIPSPIAVVSGGPGPTVLLIAGTHGDEYEGQILLQELVREVNAKDVTGTLVILPALNVLAVRESRRVANVDNANLNRALPGRPDGNPTEQLASILTDDLIPMADYLIDLHSGGSTTEYLPSAFLYAGPNRELWAEKVAAVEALNLPYSIVVKPMLKPGSISGAGDLARIPTISTELGGGGTVSLSVLRQARSGLKRLLSHWKVLVSDGVGDPGGEPDLVQWLELVPDGEVNATIAGLFEPCVALGQKVEKGELLAKVWPVEELDRSAREFSSPISGTVTIMRHPTHVDIGTTLINIAEHYPHHTS